MSPELEHRINKAYEDHLDAEWERYNEEGELDNDDYDEWYVDDNAYDQWAQSGEGY